MTPVMSTGAIATKTNVLQGTLEFDGVNPLSLKKVERGRRLQQRAQFVLCKLPRCWLRV